EVDLQRGAELEEAPLYRIVDEIDARLQRVLTDGLGKIVAELPLLLPRLLRHIGIGAEGSVRKSYQRRADMAGDQVVPILIAYGQLVDGSRRKQRIEGDVRDDQMVGGEISVGQIASAVGLVVFAVVVLRAVTGIEAVLGIDGPVKTAVIAGFVEG